MDKTLIIIRGIPGSGKTTLGNMIEYWVNVTHLYDHERRDKWTRSAMHFSEDDYWEKDGVYTFSPDTREQAFSYLLSNVLNAMRLDQQLIIVSTAATDLHAPAFDIMLGMAKHCGYSVFPLILQRNTNNPPSIHNVTDADMDRFRRTMEHELEVTI